MKNSELAEKAAELIDEHGWVRGAWGGPEMGFCLLGATYWVIGNKIHKGVSIVSISNENASQVSGALQPLIPLPRTKSIITFNDSVLQSKEAAIEFLMETAKYWRDKGE